MLLIFTNDGPFFTLLVLVACAAVALLLKQGILSMFLAYQQARLSTPEKSRVTSTAQVYSME